jgi:hypothetical protein
MENDLDFKTKLDLLCFEFARTLSKRGLMKESITLKDVIDAYEDFTENPRIFDFCHEFLCEKCHSKSTK